MKLHTEYEWGYDVLDEHKDIIETAFADKLDTFKQNDVINHELCLIRHVGNAERGLVDRQYAYVENGELPGEFDGGAKLPDCYREELTEYLQTR